MLKGYNKPCRKCGAAERGAVRAPRRTGTCLACKRAGERSLYQPKPKRADGQVKPCIQCGGVDRLPPTVRSPLGACRPCGRRKGNARYQRVGKTPLFKSKQRQYRFGLTPSEQDAMFVAQCGRCGACGDPLDQFGTDTALDHDHDTDRVRGFLCRGCNIAEGALRGSALRARKLASYLDRHRPRLPLTG